LVLQPIVSSVCDEWVWSAGGLIFGRGNGSPQRKLCPNATLCLTELHALPWGFGRQKRATNRVGYDRDNRVITTTGTSYNSGRDNTSCNKGRDNTSYNNDRDNRVITVTGTTRLAITVHNMNYNNITHVAASCTCSISQCVYRATQLLAAPSLSRTKDRPTDKLSAPLLLALTHIHTSF
jgi:hypothetical protein